jgi:hypothetical protein
MRIVITRPWPNEIRVTWRVDDEEMDEWVKYLACLKYKQRQEALIRALDWLNAAEKASVGTKDIDWTIARVRSVLFAVHTAVSELEHRQQLIP